MSKAVKRDHAFDIDKYTELLYQAQGGRSQTEFAKDCGLSVAYICKYLNKKFDKAPTPSTIKKIASHATNNVSYAALLEAAGYDSNKYLPHATSDATSTVTTKLTKSFKATILSALPTDSFEWKPICLSDDSIFDFAISITNGTLSQWNFKFINDYDLTAWNNPIASRLMAYYCKLMTSKITPTAKLSFVTDSEATFGKVKDINPHMLSMYVSIILIDADQLNIIKEEYLETSFTLNQELFTTYQLH